jgi:hypothetical protein
VCPDSIVKYAWRIGRSKDGILWNWADILEVVETCFFSILFYSFILYDKTIDLHVFHMEKAPAVQHTTNEASWVKNCVTQDCREETKFPVQYRLAPNTSKF